MQKHKTIGLVTSWNLDKIGDEYYIPDMHKIYLDYICQNFIKVYLIAPTKKISNAISDYSLLKHTNITVVEISPYSNYIKGVLKYKEYKKSIKKIAPLVDVFYNRVPDPYCWMSSLMFKKKSIMHFVGDTIDATKNNKKWSFFKKNLFILGYLPDYYLTLKAAKKSVTYTNGHHLSEKLKMKGVNATPVISSTLNDADFYRKSDSEIYQETEIKLIYLGYIRYSKGIDTLISVVKKLKDKKVKFILNVVGDGELLEEFKNTVKEIDIKDEVIFHGHVNNRNSINALFKKSDIFVFPSLSEGSPRVVLEAMANSVAVVSTPVGSLPTTFKDKEEIRFANFNDADSFVEQIEYLIHNRTKLVNQINKANEKVKNFTINNFLNKIFNNEA